MKNRKERKKNKNQSRWIFLCLGFLGWFFWFGLFGLGCLVPTLDLICVYPHIVNNHGYVIDVNLLPAINSSVFHMVSN